MNDDLKCRSEFEAWMLTQGYGALPRICSPGSPHEGEYANQYWHRRWEAWQASRRTPEPVGHEARRRSYQEGHRDGTEAACSIVYGMADSDNVAERTVQAIRAAGKVGPLSATSEAVSEPLRPVEGSDQLSASQARAVALEQHDELSHDPDGEVSIDWQNKAGDMLTMSLDHRGRLAWALHWRNDRKSGTAWLSEGAFFILDDVLKEANLATKPAQEGDHV